MMRVLVAVLAGLLPLYIIRFSILGIPTNAFEAAVWMSGIYVLIFSRARKTWMQKLRSLPRAHRIWISCFLIAAIISTINSPVLLSSLGILKGWIITPMLFGSLIFAFGSRPQIIRSLALSGCVVALLGISQVEGLHRISALYDVPNSLALFLVPIAVLSLATGVQERNRLLQLLSIPMLLAIIATQSFGAILALIGTFVLGVRRVGLPAGALAKAGVVIIAVVFLILALSGRISYLLSPLTSPGTTNSATVRLQLWDIGIDLIKKNPVFGIGLGQFEPAYQGELHLRFAEQANEANAALPVRQTGISYKLVPEYVFRDPHNFLVSFWLNTGLLGLISFIALNYLVIRKWSAISPPRMRGSRPALAGGGGQNSELVYPRAIALALISMLLFGLVDTIYWKNDLSGLWWLIIML